MAEIDKYKITEEQVRSVAEKDASSIMKDWEQGLISTEEALQKFTKVGQETTKSVARMGSELAKMTIASKKYTDLLTQQALKEQNIKKSFWEQIIEGKSNTEGLDWKLDRRVNAFNSILSGNFKYGATQFLQTFERGKILLNHPMVMFGIAAAKLGIALVDFSTKTDRFANKIAGGSLVSPNAKINKWQMAYQDYALTTMYGQNKEDLYNFKIPSFGAGMKQQLALDPRFTHAWSYGRAAISEAGGNPNQINTYMQQQVAIGRSSSTIEKFNYRLVKAVNNLDKLSTDKFLSSFDELNKTLLANNINGTANAQSLLKFQDALNRGTLAAQDFTRGLTSRRGAETSTLAGVGAMLAERGLGGKELQEAYSRGDMIAVAGAVRRGGMAMQRDIEKIAPEMSKQLGTSDWREALALQSGTAWGQLTGDLKKLEVQNILSRGGTLTTGIDTLKTNLTPQEQQDFLNQQRELIKTNVDNTNSFKALGQSIKGGALALASAYEQAQNAEEERRKSVDLNTAAMNDLTVALKIGPRYNNPTML